MSGSLFQVFLTLDIKCSFLTFTNIIHKPLLLYLCKHVCISHIRELRGIVSTQFNSGSYGFQYQVVIIFEFCFVFDLIYLAFTINEAPSASRGAHPTNVYIGAISNASDDLNGVAQVRLRKMNHSFVNTCVFSKLSSAVSLFFEVSPSARILHVSHLR